MKFTEDEKKLFDNFWIFWYYLGAVIKFLYCEYHSTDFKYIVSRFGWEDWEIKYVLKVGMDLEWITYDIKQETFELTGAGREAYEEHFSNLTTDSSKCPLLKNVKVKFKTGFAICGWKDLTSRKIEVG